MSMLAEQVDFVIGVDTHRDTNTAAAVEAKTVAVIDHTECSTAALGYKRLVAFANRHAPGDESGPSKAPAASAPG